MTFYPFNPLIDTPVAMVAPSGDTTGVSDAANINAAVAALPSSGGVVRMDATGAWYVECGQVVIDASGVLIDATGCAINAVGTGDVIRMYDSSTYTGRTVWGGGITGFPRIDGTNAGAGSAGVHIGDILQLQVDVSVANFTGTGSIGVHFDNAYYWSEQMRAHIYAQTCTSHVVFDCSGATTSTGSYDRGVIDLFIDQENSAYDGVVFQNGGLLSNGRLGIYGNFNASTSALTSAVLRLTGTIPAGHPGAGGGSSITNSVLNVGVEASTSTYGPYNIYFASGLNNISSCTGILDFSVGTFTAANNGGEFYFQGIIRGGGTALVSFDDTGAYSQTISSSGTLYATQGATIVVTPAAAVTGVIMHAGSREGQRVTIVNTAAAANSITFAASGSNVADGSSDAIAGLTARTFVWDTTSALWYRVA